MSCRGVSAILEAKKRAEDERMEARGVTVADMMAAREARAQAQRTLLARWPSASVVCLTMNVAGPVKTSPLIERAFAWGWDAVRAVAAPGGALFTADIHPHTGPEGMLAVRADARELKRRLCLLEDATPMGRLLDADVIAPDGKKMERTALGLGARRCLLCGRPAPECARSRAHSAQALFERAEALMREHFEDAFARRIGEQAQRALLTEVAVSPKPGLVDRENAGAHRDMDVFTFIDSACALRGYFEGCARTGLAHRGKAPAACFDALRTPGLLAEADMARATGGVNTHKGAIFSLGVFCASLGMGYDACSGGNCDILAALARCGEMTRERMAAELAAAREGAMRATFGERLYAAGGTGGVRAEAAGGFQSVAAAGLPRLTAARRAGLSLNDAALCALAALMARTQDTNAVRRGGEEAARALRKAAAALDARVCEALARGLTEEEKTGARLRDCLRRWDMRMSAAGVSPGGCADLLAMTLLAAFMRDAGGNS